jgi:hypothetical protein
LRSKGKEGTAENGRFEGNKPAWPLLAGLALVALLATLSCSAAGERGEGPAAGASRGGEEPQARADLGHPALGSENAAVVLIEYADFQ